MLTGTAILLAACGAAVDDAASEPPVEPSLQAENDGVGESQLGDEEAGEAQPEDEPSADVSGDATEPGAESEQEPAAPDGLVEITESDIVDELSASELPITNLEVFDAETDPNGLLGRPGQYTIKVSWEDGRLDASADPVGTIEIFPDVDSMQRRADYVEDIGRESPMLLQWVFTDERTGAVLRVSSDLTPDEAAEYEVWLESLA